MITAAQLKEDYLDKRMTMRDISAKYGIALGAVHRSVSKAGIARRNPGRRTVINAEKRLAILSMREKGQSIVAIADTLGVSRSAVWTFLKAEGLPMFWLRRTV